MGNTTSKKSNLGRRHSVSMRELEKFTQPTGLYPTCLWDPKVARRLIVNRKLAPRFPGQETKDGCFTLECPICFMFYPGSLNAASCCSKPICSECYLQIRPPNQLICCPFCNQEAFCVRYTLPSAAEMASIRSIKRVNIPRRSSTMEIPDRTEPQPTASPQGIQYASVEDRHRLRDSLRSQLSISDKPVTERPHPNSVAALNDAASRLLPTSGDAARLEELMLLEAIRRSMHDLSLGTTDEKDRLGSQTISQQPMRIGNDRGPCTGVVSLREK